MSVCRHELSTADAKSLGIENLVAISDIPHQHAVYFGDMKNIKVTLKVVNLGSGEKEANIYHIFATVGLPVPDVLGIRCIVCPDCGRPVEVLITLQIVGTNGLSLIHDGRFGLSEWHNAISVMNHQFNSLSTIPSNGYMPLRWKKFCDKYRDYARGQLCVPDSSFHAMESFVSAALNPPKLYMITHDWRSRHLIYKSSDVVGLLDVEYVDYGDPLLEVANFLHDVSLDIGREWWEIAASLGERFQVFVGDRDLLRTLYWYAARQAFSHAVIRHIAGDSQEVRIRSEIELGISYLSCRG